jgi:hypothetical protein
MPVLSLAEAAKHCGVNRSTILRAIKSGKVSGTRNDDGSWSVEASELYRVFEPKADTSAPPQPAQWDTTTDALVAELRAVIADLRRDRDAWRDQAERLALITPRTAQGKRRCNAAAGTGPHNGAHYRSESCRPATSTARVVALAAGDGVGAL